MKNIIANLPDDKAINELLANLRTKPTEEAQQLILQLLQDDNRAIRFAALRMTKRLIQNRQMLLHILDIGLEMKDISGIGFWLSSMADCLGYKQLIKRLEMVAQAQPILIIYAWYSLVPLIRQNSSIHLDRLSALCLIIDNEAKGLSQDLQDLWERTKIAVPLSSSA